MSALRRSISYRRDRRLCNHRRDFGITEPFIFKPTLRPAPQLFRVDEANAYGEGG